MLLVPSERNALLVKIFRSVARLKLIKTSGFFLNFDFDVNLISL